MNTFRDSIVEPSVSKKWQQSLRSLESKMSLGLERQLNSIVGYVRFLFSEQKKTDFRPDSQQVDIRVSPQCQIASRFLANQVATMELGCDGENLEALQSEMATRLFKFMLTHIQQFTYNSTGAVLLLCDVGELRTLVSKWRVQQALSQWESLQALTNLLAVLPDNLNDAAHSPLLENVDRQLIQDFVRLRADFRSIKNFQI